MVLCSLAVNWNVACHCVVPTKSKQLFDDSREVLCVQDEDGEVTIRDRWLRTRRLGMAT